MTKYTRTRLSDVEDVAAKYGFSDNQESRFANEDLDAEQTGLSYHRIKPGKRQPFAHRHEEAEETYVVIAGSGRLTLDEEVLEVGRLDAIRISPGVMHALEAGEDGLEVLAFGPRRPDDRGEMVEDW